MEELFGQFQLFSESAILGVSLDPTLRWVHEVKFAKNNQVNFDTMHI